MFHKIRSWYLHRKAVRAERDYNRGFEYAAGQVMRFHHDPFAMYMLRCESEANGNAKKYETPFYRGMRDAIANFEQHIRALTNGHTRYE